ncbi:MAG: hypothetical protein A2X36_00380 [Elusimicrobia bacterium GWA2_69_24]|nr:MAG: hypothetical protein A2X36_00380 [Elusimicrobia bacterium GWA2_69_24]
MEGIRPLLPDKEYFNIGEACRVLQLPPHTLRYWEARFPAFRPQRLPGGHRRYARRDLEVALRIKELLRDRKLTIAGARKALASTQRGGRISTTSGGNLPAAAVKLLREIRDDLQRLVSDLST